MIVNTFSSLKFETTEYGICCDKGISNAISDSSTPAESYNSGYSLSFLFDEVSWFSGSSSALVIGSHCTSKLWGLSRLLVAVRTTSGTGSKSELLVSLWLWPDNLRDSCSKDWLVDTKVLDPLSVFNRLSQLCRLATASSLLVLGLESDLCGSLRWLFTVQHQVVCYVGLVSTYMYYDLSPMLNLIATCCLYLYLLIFWGPAWLTQVLFL